MVSKRNVGGWDRKIRLLIGVVCLGLYFLKLVPNPVNYLFLLVSFIGFFTGILSSCALYDLFNFKTNKKITDIPVQEAVKVGAGLLILYVLVYLIYP